MGSLPDDSGFQDPLEDYSPPQFDDPVEQKLHDDPVSVIQAQPYTSVSAETCVGDVLKKMIGDDIACVMVEEDGKLVGVFSDREVLNNVALDYDNAISRPVSELMTREPVFVRESDSAAATLTVVAVSGYRHVPILNAEDKIAGIVSPRRISEYLTDCFD